MCCFHGNRSMSASACDQECVQRVWLPFPVCGQDARVWRRVQQHSELLLPTHRSLGALGIGPMSLEQVLEETIVLSPTGVWLRGVYGRGLGRDWPRIIRSDWDLEGTSGGVLQEILHYRRALLTDHYCCLTQSHTHMYACNTLALKSLAPFITDIDLCSIFFVFSRKYPRTCIPSKLYFLRNVSFFSVHSDCEMPYFQYSFVYWCCLMLYTW